MEEDEVDGGVYLCPACVIDRGYFYPKDRPVRSRRCNCDYCGEYDRCFERSDLDPVMEVKKK